MVRIFSRLSGQVNIDFYWPIQILCRNGPVGYCLFSPLRFISKQAMTYFARDKVCMSGYIQGEGTTVGIKAFAFSKKLGSCLFNKYYLPP